jgi:uncharacterized protein HemX
MATEEVKRARITAVVFGLILGISLISFVYAFVQQAEAKRQAAIAVELSQQSEEQTRLLKEMSMALDKRNAELESVANDLRDELKAAQEKLKKCKGN